ncbi:MAG: hypothetical protein B6U89_05475 [Desulfurococcales archaeon ex4484_58]|nr:MAG: hypothetical protein B6U89_05475 [Desulfurococcales archaeon ex4484_58]
MRGLEKEIEYQPDIVQVQIYLAFDEESEKALETAWIVAEELLDENIWVEIEPIHIWIDDPLGTNIYDLPKIVINGKVMFIGRAPSRKELLEAILDRVGKKLTSKTSREPVFSKNKNDGFLTAVTIDL